MSHRFHNGSLAEQHTEAPIMCYSISGLLFLAALCIAMALAGCATTTADCSDLTKGVCKVSGTRLLTDSGISLVDPKTGLALEFTSKPDQAGTQAAIAALSGVVGLLAKLVVPVPPPVGVRGPYLDDRGVAHSTDDGRGEP